MQTHHSLVLWWVFCFLLTQVTAKPLNLAQSHVLYTLMASGSV
ncbi:Uncharacterised protein [Vibrio cholerae]|nr:Uncharacterised protein [Vibrio cholerae]